MRKFVFLMVALALLIAIPAMAKDMVLQSQIKSVGVFLDKNGNEYVRIILPETRVLSGIEYNVEVVATGFRDVVEQCKTLKAGDTLKAIANQRYFEGRITYHLLKVVE